MKKKYETPKAETTETAETDAVRCSGLTGGQKQSDDGTQDVTDVYGFSWLSKL